MRLLARRLCAGGRPIDGGTRRAAHDAPRAAQPNYNMDVAGEMDFWLAGQAGWKTRRRSPHAMFVKGLRVCRWKEANARRSAEMIKN